MMIKKSFQFYPKGSELYMVDSDMSVVRATVQSIGIFIGCSPEYPEQQICYDVFSSNLHEGYSPMSPPGVFASSCQSHHLFVTRAAALARRNEAMEEWAKSFQVFLAKPEGLSQSPQCLGDDGGCGRWLSTEFGDRYLGPAPPHRSHHTLDFDFSDLTPSPEFRWTYRKVYGSPSLHWIIFTNVADAILFKMKWPDRILTIGYRDEP